MFKSIWERWHLFRATVDDTTATIRAVLYFIGIGAVATILIGKWLATLNTIQRVGLWVTGACLFIVVMTYLVDWQRKRNTDRIPELLARMDGLIFDYIDNHPMQVTPAGLVEDSAKLMNMNIDNLKSAATSGNKKTAEQEFEKFADAHSRRFNSKNFSDNIMNLRLAGAIMTEYKVGLVAVMNTRDYQKLEQQVTYLRRRLPSVVVSRSINEYFHQSEGLYNLLFSIQPFAYMGSFKDVIPVRIRAYSDVVRPIVEGHTASLINAVRESIDDYKHKYVEKEASGKIQKGR